MKRTWGIHMVISIALGLAGGTLIGLAITEDVGIYFGIEAAFVIIAAILHLLCHPED